MRDSYSSPSWRVLPAIGAAAAAILLSACSGGARIATTAVTLPPLTSTPIPTTLSGAAASLPIARYEPWGQTVQTILLAEQVVEVKCMRQHGYQKFTPPPIGMSWTASPGGGGAFGYVNVHYAASNGFAGPERQKGPALTPAQAKAVAGCDAQATPQVNPMPLADARLLADLYAESVHDTQGDPRVTTASRAWAECMQNDGFNDSSPSKLAMGPWHGAPSAKEKTIAEADAICTSRVNLAGIFFAVLAGYQRELFRPVATDLARIREESQSAAVRAKRVLAAGS
jgi:hypothetical protein